MAEPTILFVDDEEMVLKSLSRLFRKAPYRVLTAGGGQLGLDLIEGGEKPSIIVSDQSMPEMYGAEFLERASKLLPDSVRLLLTGYSDMDAATDAINKGGIYRYLNKPWDDGELKKAIRDALDLFNLVQDKKRMTRELSEKNKELADWNQHLEKKVEERTQALRKTYGQLQTKVKELEGRDRIQQHLLEVHSLEETLRTVLEVIVEVVGVDAVVLHLIDKETGKIEAAAAIGTAGGEGHMPSHRLGELMDRPLYPDVIRKVVDKHEPARYRAQQVKIGEETVSLPSFVIVPFYKGEDCVGVFEVDRRVSGEAIKDGEVKTVQNFAMQAAVAVIDSQMRDDLPSLEAGLDDLLKDFQQ